MLKQMLTAASLTLLLAGSGHAAEDPRHGKAVPEREPAQAARQKAPPPKVVPKRVDSGRADRGRDDDRGRGRDRDDGNHDWRDNDRRDHDWRDNDHDGRDRDWRRDDDWRRRGWVHQGGRNDGWRYYRGHDNRHWRYVPPSRYTFDFGYRSGYELAWRDWLAYGRHDRGWRRPGYGYGTGFGYRSGYDAGWRDAAYYYGRGYRPDYWAYDPQGGWFFGFRIEG